MKHPILKKRTQAIWDYLKEYTMMNDGTPPAVRDFVRDGVDGLTSTSLVQYHLEKLEAAGLIEMIHDGVMHRRRIKIKYGIYGLPKNVMRDTVWDDDFVTIEVFDIKDMIRVLKDNHTPVHNAVIVTDDRDVALVAIGLGLMVISTEEAKDIDEGNNS
jgi:hypothetical protein